MPTMVERLREIGLVPVIVIDDAEDAVPVAEALMEGGLPCAEVTLRTPAAMEALRRMVRAYPELLVGAGTVLSADQVDESLDAGAKFIVSPGIDPVVVDQSLKREVPVFPGVCTPTEVAVGLARGLRTVKFFPAEPAGGLPFLKAISAPYPMMEFIPTGGINVQNLSSYLGFKKVVACGGSWMVAQDWIREKDFGRVRREVEKAVQTIRDIKGGN
jgi:2-dehydro-3-deoxyphosphogluconate aldolase / (4S)-4-hydroxy-2-oxoglutarate aldolase